MTKEQARVIYTKIAKHLAKKYSVDYSTIDSIRGLQGQLKSRERVREFYVQYKTRKNNHKRLNFLDSLTPAAWIDITKPYKMFYIDVPEVLDL